MLAIPVALPSGTAARPMPLVDVLRHDIDPIRSGGPNLDSIGPLRVVRQLRTGTLKTLANKSAHFLQLSLSPIMLHINAGATRSQELFSIGFAVHESPPSSEYVDHAKLL